jgi:hypothetical protein
MKDVIQLPRYVHESRNVVFVKLKIAVLEKVLYVPQISCYQVIHDNHFKPFLKEPVSEVGTQKAGSPRDEHSFFTH